jgi:DNA-binding IclR family transcriptional regulator
MFEPAVSACACALRDRSGAAVAAVTIVAPHSLFDDGARQRKIVSDVRSIADAISRQLGFAG